jgi:Tfp pilus assembly protein PilO
MSRTRQWTLLAFGLAVVIFAAGWFFAVAPQASHAKSLKQNADSQQQQNLILQSQISTLSKQFGDVAAAQARIADIQQKLPATPDLANYVRALQVAAAASHVDLLTFSPSSPQVVASVATVVTPTAAPSASPAIAPIGAAAVPTPTAAPAPADQLQSISISLTVNGDYFAIQGFLKQLETSSRATVVSDVDLAPGAPLVAPTTGTAGAASTTATSTTATWRTLQGTITLDIFESTPSAAAAAAAVAVQAAAAAAAATTVPAAGTAAQPQPSSSASSN